MFTALRNKFLLINFFAILIIMLLSFFSIFFITFSNLKHEIHKKLTLENQAQNLSEYDEYNNITNLLPNSIMFTITVDEENGMLYIDNPYAINLSSSSYDYSNFVKLADSEILNNNIFKYGNSFFAYKKFDNKIIFLDVTRDVKVLINYIYSFATVLLFTTVVLFFFSKYLANKAILPIQKTFKKQKDFISDVSHELKTPLTIMNTNIDLVLSNSDEKVSDQEKWLKYAKDEISHMTNLINDMLYLTKNENMIKKDFNIFNFSEVCENIISQMEAIVSSKDIKLHKNIVNDLYIKGNINQIKQVLKIVIDNAIKFCNTNGDIKIDIVKQNNLVVFSITNTGMCIDKKHIPHLFDRFYKVDESRNRNNGGYGLGLSIAKNIIDNHYGNIKITSTKDIDTTVTIKFKHMSKKTNS